MADYKAPLQDIYFTLYHALSMPEFWQGLPAFSGVDEGTARAVLEEAAKLCEQEIAPLNREADEQGCQWRDGEVFTPQGFKSAYQTLCEGGWVGLSGNPDYEGMGMPKSLASAVEEMIQGACMSFGLAPMLTAGACLAINAHASDALKSLYLPKMYSGQWSGAMDLTEPHAGTDLGLIRTKAQPKDDGSYAITGTKIFITWGEHDMAENIVHLVLAKLPGAPAGSRGISLFLVPKFIPDEQGVPGKRNALSCGALEKKMGIKASATCVMNFDGAAGWLVGEPNQGLAAMFTMMNYERLVVGIQAIGASEASYQTARQYALERLQGRAPLGTQNPNQPADPIVVHPDVRRMLLTMKALNEGSRAFYLYVAKWLDAAKYGEDEALVLQARQLVALLTPVAKAYITDVAFEVAVHGQQVLGGHGYIREWGQEQLVRDIRITQIYEGTNGVQAMDLVGRKTVACDGAMLKVFVAEIDTYCQAHRAVIEGLALLEPLTQAVTQLEQATAYILKSAPDDANLPGAVAVDYLHLLGGVAYAYMWVRMACAAKSQADSEFTRSKIKTAHFYFQHLLSKNDWLTRKITSGATALSAFEAEEL